MIFIRKPGTDKVRTAVDLHERNKHTKKLTSPLLDMEGIVKKPMSKFRCRLSMYPTVQWLLQMVIWLAE